MKGKLIAAVLSLSFLLTGCSVVGIDAQTLMRPPKATGDRQMIYETLEKTAGTGFTLKYPRTGDYRSAIIMHDVTGNGCEDAIAFYQGSEPESPGCTMAVFREKDGEWEPIGVFNNVATQVDRVAFADANRDGTDEIIVGWGNSVASSSELCVYLHDKTGQIRETVSKQYYDELLVYDFDQDNGAEIFLAKLPTTNEKAKAMVMGLSEAGAIEVYGSVELDSSVTKYNHISVGNIDDNVQGVMLDGAKGASALTTLTEIIYWDKENQILKAPFSQPEVQEKNMSIRNSPVYCQDINGDGILEFPVMEPLPGATDPMDSTYLTSWNRYYTLSGATSKVKTMQVNLIDGYAVIMPQRWLGAVTVKADANAHSVIFYEWLKDETGSAGKLGTALLKIQTLSLQSWDALEDKPSFQILEQEEDRVYVASVPNPQHSLAMTLDQVKKSFSLFRQ